jgi:hypothetical protein
MLPVGLRNVVWWWSILVGYAILPLFHGCLSADGMLLDGCEGAAIVDVGINN